MQKNTLRYLRAIGLSSLFAIGLSSIALAAMRTGISPLDGSFELIGRLFNIQALRNPYVQEGFLKFMLFIVLFAVSNFALGKVFNPKGDNPQGKRVATIVSFAFSMIGIFMMPKAWLDVTGGAVAAIMSSLIFILIFYGGLYVAMAQLVPKKFPDSPALLINILAVALILLLIGLLFLWTDISGIPPI